MEKWEAVPFKAFCKSCSTAKGERVRWGSCDHPIEERQIFETWGEEPVPWPTSAKYILSSLGMKGEIDVDELLAHEKGAEARKRKEEFEAQQRALMLEPYELWCDGSGNLDDGPAGAGVVLYRWGKILAEGCFPLGSGTNNFAEISAIGRGLAMLMQRQGVRRDSPVIIKTDSEFAIGEVRHGSTWGVPPNLDKIVRDARAEIEKWPNLTFEHVDGHKGIVLNERADKLAKRARRLVIQRKARADGKLPTVAYLDTETSGKDSNKCQVLSAYLIIDKGGVIISEKEVRFRVENWARVEREALDVNGIEPLSEAWIESALPFRDAAQQLAQEIAVADVVCAHNADFDLRFVKATLQRERITFPNTILAPPLCTCNMAKMLKKNGMIPDAKLATVCDYYGVPLTEAHTSRGDTHACRSILRPLFDDYMLLKK